MRDISVTGSLLGTAVGDALGLPYEGLSRRRARRLFGEPVRQRFLFGRGMVSDDTEHACMVAQALIASGGEEERFVRKFARRLRWWLLGVPAGIGLATLRATLKLWVGVSPRRSGVYSAGNGPAMRSAILGAAVDDREKMLALVRASARVTHTDPKAEYGAIAVALAARQAAQAHSGGEGIEPARFLEELASVLPGEAGEFPSLMEKAVHSAQAGEATEDFAAAMGWGKKVSGYILQTAPVAIHAALRHPFDFQAGVMAVIRCGGDTDTTAAIVGGIIGAGVGKAGIPAEWLDRLFEWPRSEAWMERLGKVTAQVMAEGKPCRAPRLWVLGLLGRNLFFLLVVLVHVVRRCLPPY